MIDHPLAGHDGAQSSRDLAPAGDGAVHVLQLQQAERGVALAHLAVDAGCDHQ